MPAPCPCTQQNSTPLHNNKVVGIAKNTTARFFKNMYDTDHAKHKK